MFNFSGFGENIYGVFINVHKRIEGVRQFEQHVKLGTWEQTFLERKNVINVNYWLWSSRVDALETAHSYFSLITGF